MRILFITPFYKPAHVYGGPSYSVPTLCEALAKLDQCVSVFTTNANGQNNLPVPPGVMQVVTGVEVYYFQRDLPGYYFYSSQLSSACYRKISGQAFDIVYVASNWGYPFLPACRASYRARIPYVVSPRASFKRNTWDGKFLKKSIYHRLFERSWVQRAARVHYTTKLEARDSHWLRLGPPEVIIPNPVDLQEFQKLPERGKFRTKFNIAADKKVILILGRIDPDKGLDIAFQALSQIVRQFPDILLVVAGPEENNFVRVLLDLAQKLQIKDRIVFPGLLNSCQRLEALVDADLFLSASHSENFGMSIVEAMACNLPVVVSDQVGIADVIAGEKAGLVVPLDPTRMANALVILLNDPILGKQYGLRAAQVVQERFASEAVTRKLLNAFDEIRGEIK